jgi:hypothetical protein
VIGTPLSDRARRVRSVELDDQLAVTVTDVEDPYFACRVVPAPFLTSPSDSSPRDNAPRKRVVFEDPQELGPSDHVEVYRDATYELVSRVHTLRSGGREVGFEAEVIEPDVLYPAEGELVEQGGAPVADDYPFPTTIRLAVYSAFDSVRERGDYSVFAGQAPIEHEIALTQKNRLLVIGARTFRIASATPSFDVPYLTLDLRVA